MKQIHGHVVPDIAVECEPVPGCVAAALEILGDKWSPLILKEITENGLLKFSELQAALPRLSPRTLSQRLKQLEDEEVVGRLPYTLHPVRFSYSLTEKGRDLTAILRAMAAWGEKYPR